MLQTCFSSEAMHHNNASKDLAPQRVTWTSSVGRIAIRRLAVGIASLVGSAKRDLRIPEATRERMSARGMDGAAMPIVFPTAAHLKRGSVPKRISSWEPRAGARREALS